MRRSPSSSGRTGSASCPLVVGAVARRSRPRARAHRARRGGAPRAGRGRLGGGAQRACTRDSPAELAQMAKRRHAALARFGGAATGVGGIVTAVPDLAAAAWIQSRLVFFIAAAYGYDPLRPDAPGRAARPPRPLPGPADRAPRARRRRHAVAAAYVGARARARRGVLARGCCGSSARRPRALAGRMIPGSRSRSTRSATSARRARSPTRRSSSTAVVGRAQAPGAVDGGRRVAARGTAIALAIRSGGTSLTHRVSGIAARLAGVSIIVGRIALQRMPSSACSCATAWRTRSPPPSTRRSRRAPANGCSAARAETQTIAPPPASTGAGARPGVTR